VVLGLWLMGLPARPKSVNDGGLSRRTRPGHRWRL